MMKFKLDWFPGRAPRSITLKTQTRAGRRSQGMLVARTPQRKYLQPKHYASAFLWSIGLTFSWSITAPVSAAERLLFRLGPFEQSVAVSDLEEFAKTGEPPTALKPLAPLLSSEVREALNRRLQVDPQLGDKLVKDLLRSPAGKQLLEQIGVALPDSTVAQLEAALALAVRQANGLTVISFLQAYPAETITIDASSALALAVQFNAPYWQSQALGPLLERELNVVGATFRLPSGILDPADPGSYRVQQETLTLNDWKRNRRILTDIYWSEQSQGPLVVISHGFTVAAIDHPGSNVTKLYSLSIGSDPSDLLPASEFIERPKDISFLLDQLRDLNQQPGALQGKLNTQQVSVIGHSLGGYTALALAGAELNLDELRQFCKERSPLGKAAADWLQCAATDLPEQRLQLRDERVAQVMALNPLVGRIFGKTGVTRISIPTLIFAGTDDAITPVLSHQLEPFNQLRGSKYLMTAIGATHLSVSNFAPGSPGAALAQKTLVNERTGKVTEPLRQLLRGVSVAFVAQLTPEAKVYQPFLTSAYAQSLSTPEMPLRLNTQLPSSVNSWLSLTELPQNVAKIVKLPDLNIQISASALTQNWLFPQLITASRRLLERFHRS